MRTPECHKATGAGPACELADIVRFYGAAYRDRHRLPLSHLKVLRAIETCRTAALGGHRERCASCGFERYAYNSCRNRHCPKCQSLAKAQWLRSEEHTSELQSQSNLVCRLLLEKKKKSQSIRHPDLSEFPPRIVGFEVA